MHQPLLRRFWLSLPALALLSPSLACGPFFPENALDEPRRILQPPRFNFLAELYKLPADELKRHEPGSPAITLDLEMAEVDGLMQERLPDAAARKAWMERYRNLRMEMIITGNDSLLKMDGEQPGFTHAQRHEIRQGRVEICALLPRDMQLYLEGAAVFTEDPARADDSKVTKARELWQQVLALPEAERQIRGIWAAWMLFRTADTNDKAGQGKWLTETVRLARAGAADCLHLGVEAAYILGRPGSDLPGKETITTGAWKRAAYLRAMLGHGHARQDLNGDRWEAATWSEELAREILADSFLRRAQMLHLIEVAQDGTHWYPGEESTDEADVDAAAQKENLNHWLGSLEQSSIRDQKEAGMMAWICYNAAQFDAARRWLKLAPMDDVISLSLRGKLAAQEGRREESAKWMREMAKLLPVSDKGENDIARVQLAEDKRMEGDVRTEAFYEEVRRHELLADLGTIQLATNDFTGALQSFAQTDYRRDTAYIAERLVSVEELLTLTRAGKLAPVKVAAAPPKAEAGAEAGITAPLTVEAIKEKQVTWYDDRFNFTDTMTEVLMRRLMREHFFKDAARLAPATLRPAVERYAQEYKRGHDKRIPRAERAKALWTAAQLHRSLGMELFGYEDGPDNADYDGSFKLGSLGTLRSQDTWSEWWWSEYTRDATAEQMEKRRPFLPATKDETWRNRHYGPNSKLDVRYHYRYVAADLAWEAASLMPADTQETAEVLCIAGNWLQGLDPKSADRFYKALVRRNPNVPLAQEADKKRWFPTVLWKFDLLLK